MWERSNRVGVDLNTSSWTLLRYVAGITERIAHKIVEYRNQNGRFQLRTQVLEVAGIGPKSFEQAAGFLRIRNGANPLDMTAVHSCSHPPDSISRDCWSVSRRHFPIWQCCGILIPFHHHDVSGGMYQMTIAIKNVVLVALAVGLSVGTAFAQTDIYVAKCKMCHGATGLADTPTGKMLKVLPNTYPTVMNLSITELAGIISAGKGKMPAYKGKFSDAQITDLARYFKNLK
jgi:competence ComEA-like helix-hairpin-helix protein